MLKSKLYISTKPIYLMGFVIFGVLLTSFFFSLWVLKFEDWLFLWILPAPDITNWGILVAALVAMIGWLVTSIITTRNSIKQHTVTTLLQTRLSAEYMKHAHVINELLEQNSELLIDSQYLRDNLQVSAALSYVLNYVEFLSAGLRTGDFDNLLLKLTMKGIFKNLFSRCGPLLMEIRQKNPNGMEHFVAVCEFWIKEDKKISSISRVKMYFRSFRSQATD